MMQEKVQYTVALIAEFANKFGLSDAQAARYLSRYGAIDLCDEEYGIIHTQPFQQMVIDLAQYCRNNGGML